LKAKKCHKNAKNVLSKRGVKYFPRVFAILKAGQTLPHGLPEGTLGAVVAQLSRRLRGGQLQPLCLGYPHFFTLFIFFFFPTLPQVHRNG
jgi:hypothetical protein